MKAALQIIFLVLLILVVALQAAAAPLSDIEKKVDSLFILASSGELKYRDMVKPAQDSIAAMGAEAVPRLIKLYDTQVARERHAINDILVKIGHAATPYLLEMLSNKDPEKVARLCYSLGNIGDSAAVDGIVGIAFYADWRVRSNAVSALGKIGHNGGDETVIKLLADSVDGVRKSAVVAAGKLLIEKALPVLVHLLGDDFYGARMCASEALIKFEHFKVLQIISDSLNSENIMLGNLGLTTLGKIGGDSAASIISTQLTSDMPIRRALAAEAIMNSNSSLACGAVEILRETEIDSMVIFYLEKVMENYAPR